MNKDEQIVFVKALTEDLAKQLIIKIENGRIPESWDGLELRWLIQEQVTWNNYSSKTMKKRKREFKNTCLVNGLQSDKIEI